ncbi:MAG: hypothetical protein LDLANPLL_02363 [Turneriella sp.]|nr:hypothetical protein [Turneriella sp.]
MRSTKGTSKEERIPFTIGIERLRIESSVGVFDFEKKTKQDIFVSAKLFFINSKIHIDSLQSSLDYDSLCNTIKGVVGERHYETIENLAYCIAKKLKEVSRAMRISIQIDKPLAAQKNNAQNIFVSVTV